MPERIGAVAYKLVLYPFSAIHQNFHISQLRQAKGASQSSLLLPPQLSEDFELGVELDSLLDVRQKQNGAPGRLEVLIKWKICLCLKQLGRISIC